MRTIAGFLLALTMTFGLARVAAADDISPADQASIRGMISNQIEAFRRDDGNAAYGFASPTIQGLFPTADQFMSMVRNAYQPVYRPQSVTFGQLSDSPAGPLQKVFLVGPDGKSYVAVYSLQRQPDGSWRINGCTLVEDTGATI
jgi:uncharacterized protein DUF4864